MSCYALGSNGHMGECLMRAVITHRFSTFIALLQWLADLLSVTFLFIWKPCCLSFPNSKDICCLPHQHDNLFTVCQSLVGLDTILYTLSIFFVFLQIERALTPFHQENVIVQLFLHAGGLCQNTMHAGLHKLWYPVVRDRSTWSKFGAHGEHGDVFLFSNLGAL